LRSIGYLIAVFFSVALQAQDAARLLSELIKFKSVSGKEKACAKYLLDYCQMQGLQVRVFSESDSSFNFSASLLPLSLRKPNIVFINHMDVVDVENENEWREKPYSGKIAGDTIWGRGALDMKAMAVMQLTALIRIKDSILQHSNLNATVLFLSGEESGGKNGAKIICDKFISELTPAVVFGEGGGAVKGIVPGRPDKDVYFVSVAEKKSLWISLEAKVNSHGHASIPGEMNANKSILKTIYKVENNDNKVRFSKTSITTFHKLGKLVPGFKGFLLSHVNWWLVRPLRKKILNSNEFFMPTVQNTFQLTKIENSAGALNQIPQVSRAYFDCRLLPRENSTRKALRRIHHLLDKDIQMRVVDESPDAPPTSPETFYYHFRNAILRNNKNAEVIPFLNPATSDNSYFRAVGVPAYGVMPCMLSAELMMTIHGTNERIPVSALNEGINIYSDFLRISLAWERSKIGR
jgi:carboxypeptidase PM20D1